MSKNSNTAKFFASLAESIWDNHKRWLLFALLTIGFLIAGIPRLEYILDYTRFYSEKSEVTQFNRTFQEQFTGDPDAIWLMPETEHHAFHSQSLEEIRELTDTLWGFYGVESITSLTNIQLPIKEALGYRTERLVYDDQISSFDSSRVMNLPFLHNQLVSKDGRYPAVVLRFEKGIEQDSINGNLLKIESLLKDRFQNAHIAGRYWGEAQYSILLRTETIHGIIGSLIVLTFMLYLLFRRVGSIILPALAISLGVLAFFGLKGWFNWPIDILGVLFPPLLLIVGLSDVVHLYAKIQWKLQLKLSLREAVKQAWNETGYATFLTSLTTGIGFMSLLTADIVPIKNFGFEAGWGVFIMFATCMIVVPVFLRSTKKKALLPMPASNEQWTNLGNLGYGISKHSWIVPAIVFTLILIASFGAAKVESGVKNFWQVNPSTTLSQDLSFFDSEFGGARYLEIGINRKDGERAHSAEDIQVIEKLALALRKHPAIGSVIAASDMPSALNMARVGGSTNAFHLASSTTQINNDLDKIYDTDIDGYHGMISYDEKLLRISARLANVKTDSAFAVQDYARNELSKISDEYNIRFTGTSVIMDTTNDLLVVNMFQSLLLAFVVIAALMGMLFRSARMLIISLLPNVLPLLIAMGIIGYFHIPLGTSTALILTIGFVIAVDDTIHYLIKFRMKWIETGDVHLSVKDTNAQVGRAMVLSSMVMLAAFIPQFFSNFLEQFYFALVISGVVISALLSDLLLLPWLLLKFFKTTEVEKKKESKG